MTPTAADRRLSELEAEVARITPPEPPPAWLDYASDSELTTAMLLFDGEKAEKFDDLSEASQLRLQLSS